MNGPFFCERMLLGLPLHNELVGSFVVSGFVPQCRLTPGSHRMIPLHTAFASAVRMIDRIHYHATHGWANSHVARASGLSNRNVFMVQVAHLTDRRYAVDVYQPNFTRRKFHMGVAAFLRHKLRRRSRAASHLRAFSGAKLDVVNGRTERNVSQGQRIADQDVRFRTGDHFHADFQPDGLQNVSMLTVSVTQESDEGGPIRIVFNGFDHGGNPDFVTAKIDHAIVLLISPSAMPDRQMAVTVAAIDTVLAIEQRFVRLVGSNLLLVINDGLEAKRVGFRSKSFNSH